MREWLESAPGTPPADEQATPGSELEGWWQVLPESTGTSYYVGRDGICLREAKGNRQSGRCAFRGGRWEFVSSDGGSERAAFTVRDTDTLVLVGPSGPIIWRRRGAGALPADVPAAGSVTGRVTRVSRDRLTVVLDRDQMAYLKKGLELSFALHDGTKGARGAEAGSQVTVDYARRGEQLLATAVRVFPWRRDDGAQVAPRDAPSEREQGGSAEQTGRERKAGGKIHWMSSIALAEGRNAIAVDTKGEGAPIVVFFTGRENMDDVLRSEELAALHDQALFVAVNPEHCDAWFDRAWCDVDKERARNEEKRFGVHEYPTLVVLRSTGLFDESATAELGRHVGRLSPRQWAEKISAYLATR